MIELTLPDLGGLAGSATITAWEKAPGDWVRRDEMICRVWVEGQEMGVHSTADGYLERHLVAVGRPVRGGESLAEVGAPGETRLRAVPDDLSEATRAQGEPSARGEAAAPTTQDAAAQVPPSVASLAAEHGVDLSTIRGTGIGGRIRAQDVLAEVDPLFKR
jgi:pyruvate/2-oxoglutarate dehydrogenase complex dihydrolipoamide acyltransferase (E2) component